MSLPEWHWAVSVLVSFFNFRRFINFKRILSLSASRRLNHRKALPENLERFRFMRQFLFYRSYFSRSARESCAPGAVLRDEEMRWKINIRFCIDGKRQEPVRGSPGFPVLCQALLRGIEYCSNQLHIAFALFALVSAEADVFNIFLIKQKDGAFAQISFRTSVWGLLEGIRMMKEWRLIWYMHRF